jgi:hypothetical protein
MKKIKLKKEDAKFLESSLDAFKNDALKMSAENAIYGAKSAAWIQAHGNVTFGSGKQEIQ